MNKSVLPSLLTAAISLLPSSFVTADEEVTVYRDEWGVPHVYADTAAAGAYGLGYAQAEDRLGDIYEAVRTGMGTMSEAFGKKHIQTDYIMRLWKNEELSREYWETATPHIKDVVVAFVEGIRAYEAKHPEKVPEHAMKLEPWMLLTVGRAMTLRWPVGTIMDDLKEGERRASPPEGSPGSTGMRSNQWAVARERTAENIPILLTDPHLTWEGLAVLYEARVHAGDLHMNGYFLIGSPIVGIGHTEKVGWAMTTGGPDTSDVYEMKIRVFPKPQYEYDGEWRDATVTSIEIPVKGGGTVKQPAFYTHLGPVMKEPDLVKGTAMVGASPYFEEKINLFEQSWNMAVSENVHEFFDALGMSNLNEQNLMFADTSGEIGYLRSGATPIRPDGYDWDAPVPGHTSKTAWKGIHPAEDLVHLFNPARGYMQNCNISPKNMLVDSPLTPDKYPEYIYNVSWDTTNPRGRRTVHLLENDDSVTKEEAIAYAMDVFDQMSPVWQKELQSAVDSVGDEGPKNDELQNAVDAILAWDGKFLPEATATSVYKFWRLKCGSELELSPLAEGKPLDNASRRRMLELLSDTITEMTKQYGKWDVAWGDLHKVGRGGKLFPVGGADFSSGNKAANFAETLFDVRSSEDPDQPGQFIANNGSMAMMVMFFHKDGIESFTCTPWGQSADPNSVHYMDQGEKLYSQRKMKPTWWKKSDLMHHVESTTTLTVPTH